MIAYALDKPGVFITLVIVPLVMNGLLSCFGLLGPPLTSGSRRASSSRPDAQRDITRVLLRTQRGILRSIRAIETAKKATIAEAKRAHKRKDVTSVRELAIALVQAKRQLDRLYVVKTRSEMAMHALRRAKASVAMGRSMDAVAAAMRDANRLFLDNAELRHLHHEYLRAIAQHEQLSQDLDDLFEHTMAPSPMRRDADDAEADAIIEKITSELDTTATATASSQDKGKEHVPTAAQPVDPSLPLTRQRARELGTPVFADNSVPDIGQADVKNTPIDDDAINAVFKELKIPLPQVPQRTRQKTLAQRVLGTETTAATATATAMTPIELELQPLHEDATAAT